MAMYGLLDLENIEMWLRRIFTAVSYAKTPTDAMRVNVENQQAVTVQNGLTSQTLAGGLAVGPYANNSWNIMDARDPQRELSEQHFAITRQRWTIT